MWESSLMELEKAVMVVKVAMVLVVMVVMDLVDLVSAVALEMVVLVAHILDWTAKAMVLVALAGLAWAALGATSNH